MIVHNKGNFARVANGVTVIPGANTLTGAEAKAFTKHPIIKTLIKNGEIVVPEGEADDVKTLAGLKADEAIALVKDTHSVEFLEQFKEDETRTTVLAAVDEQLATLQKQ